MGITWEPTKLRRWSAVLIWGPFLGPLLFLIYINDMAFVSTQRFSLLFADDTNMFGTDNDIEALIVNVKTELEKIVKWLNANKLSLNIDKTHYMLFRNKGKVVKRNM